MHFTDTPDLLHTKLLPPRPRTPLVAREALLARLDAALTCKLTLCVAPAGFGKTTLVSQWLAKLRADHDNAQCSMLNAQFNLAWVSLEEGDNDPVRFWRYVLLACQAFQDGFGRDALARLHVSQQLPFAQPSLEPVLTAFLNDAAALTDRGVLVLEDYHVITAGQIHGSLAYVIDRLPPLLHLIVISRGAPPLSLARLRAAGELCELGTEDLRFSPAETAAFLAQTLPGSFAPELVAGLDERTEGWAVGLRLASIALRGHAGAEIERLPDTFNGSQAPVVDYLVAEVLHAQPEPVQSFLLQTSVLSRLSASLCDAVAGRDDSAELLAWIEQANLFLLPLDETHGWYRYHALFAEAMHHEARRRLSDQALRACYARAGAWYEQHGMLADAIDAALAAELWERAASLMEPIAEALNIEEPREPHTARRWLEQLPEAILHQRPALCFGYGFALLHTSDRPPAQITARLEQLAQLAEQGWRREGKLAKLGPLCTARALFALWTGRMDQAISWSRQALEWLPATDVTWRGVCLGFVGKGDMEQGKFDTARRTLLEARALTEASRHATRAHTLMLATVCAGQGEPHQAVALCRQALADALDDADLSDQGWARLGLAQLAYEWDDLDGAECEARAACEIGAQLAHEGRLANGALMLARIRQARGAPQEAQRCLAALLAQVSPHRAPLLYREILAQQARLHLATGDLAAVQRWVTARTGYGTTLPSHLREQEDLLVARLLTAQGRAEDALRLLDRRHASAAAGGRLRSVLEIQVLMALAYAAGNHVEAAGRALREALLGAHSPGYRRLFLDEGAALVAPLRGLAPTLREPSPRDFAHTLLQTLLLAQAAPDLAAPLSRQEQRVLRLLAAGRSNPEIAEELVVSVNTVKTQLKDIYRKLHVTSRQEARAIASHLHLL